ncbi:hypothetical protein SAMN05216389_11260 [Oceanobacillus limi]|uniref:Uncharacterized protein n=1 Tax=Oceanobacillus limi TaxID=930131 RepID=A0A1I0EQV1_9BACI|nr:class III lanthipeptide [Oceanobacillus limi]SET47862.1 hypothetical protein SAMN05216389_11259 [Oceanobacillus limi]SET47886.1 hypothetical protein SAMN05216389_11260 [Oceanobacillus limi]
MNDVLELQKMPEEGEVGTQGWTWTVTIFLSTVSNHC